MPRAKTGSLSGQCDNCNNHVEAIRGLADHKQHCWGCDGRTPHADNIEVPSADRLVAIQAKTAKARAALALKRQQKKAI